MSTNSKPTAFIFLTKQHQESAEYLQCVKAQLPLIFFDEYSIAPYKCRELRNSGDASMSYTSCV